MAKARMGYLDNALTLEVTGSNAFVAQQSAAFWEAARKHWEQPDPDMMPMVPVGGEDVKPQNGGAAVLMDGAVADVVAIYDNAGIPSIMHRFRRITNRELFGGSERFSKRVHSAFIIGGKLYDEIYISVYPNTMIDGKPYSLPYREPVFLQG